MTYRIAVREMGVSPRGFMHGVTRANRSNRGDLAWRVSPTKAVKEIKINLAKIGIVLLLVWNFGFINM